MRGQRRHAARLRKAKESRVYLSWGGPEPHEVPHLVQVQMMRQPHGRRRLDLGALPATAKRLKLEALDRKERGI